MLQRFAFQAGALVLLISTVPVHGAPGDTALISVKAAGNGAAGASKDPAISGDGRFIAFESRASTLIANDSTFVTDIFVRDRQTGQTELVSRDAAGAQLSQNSANPSLSTDGRYVAFEYGNGNSSLRFIRLKDRQTGVLTNASANVSDEAFSPALSGNGRYVSYTSGDADIVSGDSNGALDIFLFDAQTAGTDRVSVGAGGAQANGPSFISAVSSDGRYVAFNSRATNLVAADGNGTVSDIFVRDRQTGQTELASVASGGTQANGDSGLPIISADGRYVAFFSSASNLVANDTNGVNDVFIHDRQTGATVRVSVDSSGAQGNGSSEAPSLSTDGRYVSLRSDASNLVAGDTNGLTDIFVRDLQTGQTQRMSVSSTAAEANGNSVSAAISGNGRFVAFDSLATNLAGNDANITEDVYLHERAVAGSLNYTLRPARIDFGRKAGGTQTAPRSVTLANTGTAPLPIVPIKLRGTNPGQFAFTSTCGASVPAGGSCALNVAFRPKSLGVKTAVLAVDAGGGAPDRSVTLTGQGT